MVGACAALRWLAHALRFAGWRVRCARRWRALRWEALAALAGGASLRSLETAGLIALPFRLSLPQNSTPWRSRPAHAAMAPRVNTVTAVSAIAFAYVIRSANTASMYTTVLAIITPHW